MNDKLSLAVIGATAVAAPPGGSEIPLLCYPDWPTFVAAGRPATTFLSALADPLEVAKFSLALRSSPDWHRIACSLPGTPGSPLLDGEANIAETIASALHGEARRQTLNLPLAAMEPEERLLAYLYLRDGARLLPVLDPAHRFLYRYPLAEAIAGDTAAAPAWIDGLLRRGLLESQEPVDRLRHCPDCASAQLLYSDVCPRCTGVDIAPLPLLRCLGCGHAGEESAFAADDGLRCPFCRASLRRAGVDCERLPAGNRCRSCGEIFAEPEVRARCLGCGGQNTASRLEIREIGVLRLSSRGRVALRAGDIAESFAALESVNYVVPAYFQHLLGWLMLTGRRHPELSFGLIRIEFPNLGEIITRLGATRGFMLLDEFARRLREALRASDVSTRTAEDHLLVLLPFTPPEQVAGKLEEALAAVDGQRPTRLQARLRLLAWPRDIASGETPEHVLARL